MGKKTDSSQQLFIERIKQSLPASHSLVDELSDLLELSPDSAYRRIRGETAFTLDEIIKICNAYKISFDSFCIQQNSIVNFKYWSMTNDPAGMTEYFKRILEDMKTIDHAPKKEIIYVAEDIPVFHLFKFPELASFKIFYWMKSVMNVPELEGKKYDHALLPSEIFETGKQILNLYKRFPSIEIWSERTISSIMKQIDYYYEAGLFAKKNDGLHICDVLSSALEDIQKMAEKTTKADTAGFEENYTLYYSDNEIGNNYILVNLPDMKHVYLSHHTCNNMVTADHVFCDDTEQWLKGIIKKSTLISGVSEKQRNRYFMKAQEQIMYLKDRLR